MSEEAYGGGELEVFAVAVNWKRTYRRHVAPFGNRVLEAGAGIGATTAALCDGTPAEWLCLEPDARLAEQIEGKIRSGSLPGCCRVLPGTLADLGAGERFDDILYIDVLEHIQDDRGELARAAEHLAPGGRLIVLAPAYSWLYSPFDRSIGHHRRYGRAALRMLTPPGCMLSKLIHLDALGILLSLANRALLRQELPTRAQILFWDRWVIRLTRPLDWLTGYRVGRSLLAVWKRVQ